MYRALLIFFILLWPFIAEANVSQGNKLFHQGDYTASVKEYEEALKKNPESDVIHFNLGTALYKNGDYQSAEGHLEKSLLSDRADLKQKAYYNLANTYYQLGIKNEKDNKLTQAISLLEKSMTDYQRALELNPKDKDAKDNIDFTKKEIEDLKKKLKELARKKDRGLQENQVFEHDEKSQNKRTPSEDAKDKLLDPQAGQNQQTDESQVQQQQKKEGSEEQSSSDKQKDSKEQAKSQAGQQNVAQKIQQKDQDNGNGKTADELTSKEAQMLIQEYLEGEEPKGLLKFYHGSHDEAPVLKDW